MHRQFCIVLAVIFLSALASGQECEPVGNVHYWGINCTNVCGECYVDPEAAPGTPLCNSETGECANGCIGDYSGLLCDQATCKNGCGSGECIAPGLCYNCGSISKITPNCEDIRIRGLLGSLIAFIVIITAITLCGLGSVWYKRRKNTSVSL